MSAKTIRSLLVRLGVKADTGAVKEFGDKLETVKSGALRAVVGVGAFAAAVTAAAASTWLAVGATASHAEAVTQQAGALGVTTAELQELNHVFAQFPIGAEGTVQVLNKIGLSLADLRAGSATAVDGFRGLGLSAKDLKDLSVPDALNAMADAFAKTEDKQKRLVALNRIFGDDLATKIAPALENGSAGIRDLRNASIAMGLVLDEQMLGSLNRVKGQMQVVRGVVANLGYRFGAALAPAIDVATESFLDWYQANAAWIALKFEDGSRAVKNTFDAIARTFSTADRFVRETLGGWENAFEQTGKAIVAVGIPAALAVITLSAVAAGAALFTVFAGITVPVAILLGAVGFLTAAFAALLVIGEDLHIWYQGGDSIFGRYLGWLGIQDHALESAREGFAALVEAGRAFMGLLDALLAPLGGTSGAVTYLLEVMLGLWRVMAGFAISASIASFNEMIAVVRTVTGWVERLAEVLNGLPSVSSRVGKLADLFDTRSGSDRQNQRDPILSRGIRSFGESFDNMLAPRASPAIATTTVGDVLVNVTNAGASAAEIGDAVRRATSDGLKRAYSRSVGGDR